LERTSSMGCMPRTRLFSVSMTGRGCRGSESPPSGRKASWKAGPGIKLLALAVAVTVLMAGFRHLRVQDILTSVLVWVSGLGVWGPVIFVVLYISACVLLVPGTILTLGAGVLFGVVKGSVIVSISATLGATAAFLVCRYAARDRIASRIEGNPRFKSIDEAVARDGWKIVGLTRLSPVFPFVLLNYAYGLTSVSLRDYFFASWLGMMPGTVMYVYIGSLAGDLALLGAGGRTRTTAEWVLYGVGFLATVLVTVLVTRIARSALRKKI
jgi:uncharacterized membrane protein YdjX (TVP38/TMEM64 family)